MAPPAVQLKPKIDFTQRPHGAIVGGIVNTSSEGYRTLGVASTTANPRRLNFVKVYQADFDHPDPDDAQMVDWLPDANEELEEARMEAAEDDVIVADRALDNAKEMLEELAERVAKAPLVEVFPDGSIAIDFRNENRDSVLFVCDPDGSGACFQCIGNEPPVRTRSPDALNVLEAVGWNALRRAGFV